jgi:hypothetical protein
VKKISYEPHRNFLLSQFVKNLLRKWSVFVWVFYKNILTSGIEPKTPGWLVQDPTTRLTGDLIPTIRGSGAHPGRVRQKKRTLLPPVRNQVMMILLLFLQKQNLDFNTQSLIPWAL